MSERVEIRLLLAKFPDDTEPVVVASVDRTIWEHWEDADEEKWRKDAQHTWGLDPTDLEWREVWAWFHPDDLVRAFATPEVQGRIK